MCTTTGGVGNIIKGVRVVWIGEIVRNLCRLVDTVPSGAMFGLVRYHMTTEGESTLIFKVELDRMT